MKQLILLISSCLIGLSSFAQLNCNTVNSSISVSTNNSTVTLTNNSTPLATNNIYTTYTIRWGDGSFSQVGNNLNRTHTYVLAGTYTIKFYSSVLDSINNILCKDSTTASVTVTGLPCAASLTKTASSALTYTFTANNINSTPGMTFSWNFGDGTTGTGSPITHTYTTGSYYVVRLTVTTPSCVDTVKTIINNTPPPNVIKGTINYDSTLTLNSTDSFKIWLIKFDSSTNILSAVDSQLLSVHVGSSARYKFSNKPSGSYRTKAAHLNGPTTGTANVPTYYDSDIMWNNATVINHTGASTSGKNITMKTGTAVSGPGFVAGNVNQGANKGTANGIANMNVYIVNNSNNVVQHTVTDPSGKYTFSNLPIGSYKVYPENLGDMTTPAAVVISNTKQTLTDISFERSNKNKTIKPKPTGISTNSFDQSNYSIYPNPAKNELHIDFDGRVDNITHITLTDVTGKVINTIPAQSKNTIDISKVARGLYLINIKANDISFTQKVVIQ